MQDVNLVLDHGRDRAHDLSHDHVHFHENDHDHDYHFHVHVQITFLYFYERVNDVLTKQNVEYE